jgi:cytoskeleton protein RodZ
MEARVEAPLPPEPRVEEGPGARLRAAREAAGLSLDQVAQQLKLAPRQVKALEDEDFARLPGRTFARGFVRNYARLLNLDGDDLLALLPDGNAPALEAPALQSTSSTIAELPVATVARSTFTRWLIPILLVACIVGAAAYEWYRGTLALPGGAARTAAAAVETERATPSPPASAPAAGTSTTPLPNPLAVTPQAAETAAAETSSAPAALVAPESVDGNAAAPAPLVLTYRGPSWTEIRDRSGQVLISRLVAAGSEQPIRGSPPFDIVIGNAPEVVLVYRGKPVDLARYTRQRVARLRLP